jgi:hypothetical protein
VQDEACLQWLCAIAVGTYRRADNSLSEEGRELLDFIRGRCIEDAEPSAIRVSSSS